MYAVVTNWKIKPNTCDDDQYDAFLLSFSQEIVPILRNFGMLDVFTVRVARDHMKFIVVYDAEEDASLATETVMTRCREFVDQHIDLIDRSGGPANDLLAIGPAEIASF